jgi:uncharacterized protein (DUF486 family)
MKLIIFYLRSLINVGVEVIFASISSPKIIILVPLVIELIIIWGILLIIYCYHVFPATALRVIKMRISPD